VRFTLEKRRTLGRHSFPQDFRKINSMWAEGKWDGSYPVIVAVVVIVDKIAIAIFICSGK